MSDLLPPSVVPGRTRPIDDLTCPRCGHEWHGLDCRDCYGPTDTSFPWPSLRGEPCRCPSSYVEEPDATLEPPC